MTKKPLAVLSRNDLDIALFASTDSARPMICHVLVRRKGSAVQLIATDSYIAAIRDVPAIESPDFKPLLIPAETLAMVKKVVGKHDEFFGKRSRKVNDKVHLYADRLEIPERNITVAIKTDEDATKYPDLDKLIKGIDRTKAADITLNAKLLERAINFAGSDKAGMGNNACKIVINDKYAPVEITNGMTYALVMPLKG